MAGEDRLTLLGEQKTLTGIDFVQVVDPHDQHVLRVFFVVNPAVLQNKFATNVTSEVEVSIIPDLAQPGEHVPIADLAWVKDAATQGRTVLQITVGAPGDFRRHRLTLRDKKSPPRFDRFFDSVLFSFKQGCPSVFDCRQVVDCPPDDPIDFPVDYLARDFVSLRNALLDFSAQRYPLWKEPTPADPAYMIAEMLAALGDEFAYIQDRAAREAHLDTAYERRSLRRHATLIDYPLDDGQSATTELMITVKNTVVNGFIPPRSLVTAVAEGADPLQFETGLALSQRARDQPFFVSQRWNMMSTHVPDPGQSCVPVGATELYLDGTYPDVNDFVPPKVLPQEACDAWIGKRVLIASDPSDPSKPLLRQIVTLAKVEHLTDPLQGNQAITHLVWNEPLEFSLCLEDPVTFVRARVCANIVPATAGETCTALYAIGDTGRMNANIQLLIPIAVEREGPQPPFTRRRADNDPVAELIEEADEELAAARRVIKFLPLTKKTLNGIGPFQTGQSLSDTETDGLGIIDGRPEIIVAEANSDGTPGIDEWSWQPSLLRALPGDKMFTLDDGIYRDIISFPVLGGDVYQVDRASAKGISVRFGDSAFGLDPPDGLAFHITYRTHLGTRANVAAGAINTIPLPSALTLGVIASEVSNPLAVTTARDPMPAELIKRLAPDAYKANPLFAVRDEDYRAILEREPFVQQAGARARWTGSWLTEFVALDQRGAYGLDPGNRDIAEAVLDEVRQAGRPAFIMDPDYLPVDLRIRVCVKPGFYAGQVIEEAYRALTGPRQKWESPPYFNPDRFTFGTKLERASIEAAVQDVPGVLGVEEVQLRVRGQFDWRDFVEFAYDPGVERIIQLENDPDHPEAGSLFVTDRELVA